MRVEVQEFVFKFIIYLGKPLLVVFKVFRDRLVVYSADEALLQKDLKIILLLDEVGLLLLRIAPVSIALHLVLFKWYWNLEDWLSWLLDLILLLLQLMQKVVVLVIKSVEVICRLFFLLFGGDSLLGGLGLKHAVVLLYQQGFWLSLVVLLQENGLFLLKSSILV